MLLSEYWTGEIVEQSDYDLLDQSDMDDIARQKSSILIREGVRFLRKAMRLGLSIFQ